jgi:DNA replication protein DnaC
MSKSKEQIQSQLQYLGLKYLEQNWDQLLADAKSQKPSYYRFLTDILENESFEKTERRRQSRLKRANIPEMVSIETFPFQKQPQLDKQFVMEA